MIEMNKNVVYVKGAVNGALYHLDSGNVFAVNSASCNVIEKYINNESLHEDEKAYIEQLVSNGLVGHSFQPAPYATPSYFQKLTMCWLEITQRCNCKCIHCYEGELHEDTQNPLELEDWKKIIDQVAELGVKRVVVIGGEPCLYNRVEDILAHLYHYGIDTTIFTNGTCLTEDLFHAIAEYQVRFKCSLYGHTAQVHDAITRHPGSYEKLMNTICRLKEAGADIAVSVVFMRENELYYDKIIEFVKSLGVHYSYDVIREVFGGIQSDHLPCNTEIIHSVMRTNAKFQRVSKKKFDTAMLHNTCWYGKLAVCDNGDVIPCVFERNIVYGNIRQESLSTILRSPKLIECWDCTFDCVEECKCCEFRFACKDCRPLADSCGGKKRKNPRCTYNVYKGEWNE